MKSSPGVNYPGCTLLEGRCFLLTKSIDCETFAYISKSKIMEPIRARNVYQQNSDSKAALPGAAVDA